MTLMAIVSAAPLLEKRLKSCYKHATLTQYWIPKQGDKDMLNNGKTVTLNGPKTKTLKTKNGKTIAKVSKTTYEKFQMEGTGLLENGIMVNLDSGKNTFLKVNRKKAPYGLEMDGLKLPDGKTHNGCVRVDDKGWSFDDCQLDFYVLQFSAYKKLDHDLPNHVTVQPKKCKVQSYVTSAVKAWAELN
ncbi:hypothetical protein [Absidia glauca]|uniref:Uncharacterized protein n=1 Tax=Absidia glauca TaxID=4829 RepID=A0A163K9G6_ABSGL|nr:hypothetical protein [Absidia glauca]